MNSDNISTQQSKRWVVKIGSSLITDDGQGLNLSFIKAWMKEFAELRNQGYELILVSSGAVAEGMARLGWKQRPRTLHELQAAAAIGQMGLVQAYEQFLQHHDLHSAQVLLTHEDLRDRQRYINARSTLTTLLELGVIPVVNENDTVATDEIRFGDNDNLAALVANLISADQLIILTDQAGIFDKNPNEFKDAKLIESCATNDRVLDIVAGPSHHALGQGGMLTKVSAARRAERSGTSTIITSGKQSNALLAVASGKYTGTTIMPTIEPLTARKQWIANQLQVVGKIQLDAGASNVIRSGGASLLPIGVKSVQGVFKRGDLVACNDEQGNEIARGLINYNSDETNKILGKSTSDIESTLGYIDEPELINRDNLAVL
ncbi:MAG: glutamate 5-kinase [Gammaproteobacteria bacterium]|nr:glutamate 5-kinase [Gammaproteobacteria bacterium]